MLDNNFQSHNNYSRKTASVCNIIILLLFTEEEKKNTQENKRTKQNAYVLNFSFLIFIRRMRIFVPQKKTEQNKKFYEILRWNRNILQLKMKWWKTNKQKSIHFVWHFSLKLFSISEILCIHTTHIQNKAISTIGILLESFFPPLLLDCW